MTAEVSIIRELTATHSGFRWIDITCPSKADLARLAREFKLHETAVEDCLEPFHLPKYERHDTARFIILRSYDPKHAPTAGSVLELSRKTAIFLGEKFILTIHRRPIPFLDDLFEKWRVRFETYDKNPANHVALTILSAGFDSFDSPIEQGIATLERFESVVFGVSKRKLTLAAVYHLRRQASAYQRILRLSHEVVTKFFIDSTDNDRPFVQDLKDDLENTLFYAEDFNENLNHLVNLYHAMESQKANEVMRILTLFSAFLLPLTLIAGIYGMNFKFMPELEWPHGYAFALGIMAITAACIYIWFKKKKWL